MKNNYSPEALEYFTVFEVEPAMKHLVVIQVKEGYAVEEGLTERVKQSFLRLGCKLEDVEVLVIAGTDLKVIRKAREVFGDE